MFPEKPGVMAARELTADDVVFTYDRLDRVRKRSSATSTTSTRSRRPTATQWCSPSRNSTPSGTTASATATSPRSIPRRSWPPALPTGRTSTAPGRSCSPTSCRVTPHLHEESELLGQGNGRRHRLQAALRRQDHLSHHQGRGDLHHRAAHRQAGHPGEHPLAECRAAQEERAHAAVVEVAQYVGNVPVDARRH